jgi:hypothetical protein
MRFLSVASHLLHSGFLQTNPRGPALAVGSWLSLLIMMSPGRYSHRGLPPHKFAPMLGAHCRFNADVNASHCRRLTWALGIAQPTIAVLMLSPEVQESATRSVLCWLATVDEVGQPNVSPKEIFAGFDSNHLVIANIASPKSGRNI